MRYRLDKKIFFEGLKKGPEPIFQEPAQRTESCGEMVYYIDVPGPLIVSRTAPAGIAKIVLQCYAFSMNVLEQISTGPRDGFIGNFPAQTNPGRRYLLPLLILPPWEKRGMGKAWEKGTDLFFSCALMLWRLIMVYAKVSTNPRCQFSSSYCSARS